MEYYVTGTNGKGQEDSSLGYNVKRQIKQKRRGSCFEDKSTCTCNGCELNLGAV